MHAAFLALAFAAALPRPEFAQSLVVPPSAAEMLLIRRAPVALPPEALQLGIRGRVRFTMYVRADGRVESAYLLGGHPLLVEAARTAVLQYRFKPLLHNAGRVRGGP